jgi:hypothetical protein
MYVPAPIPKRYNCIMFSACDHPPGIWRTVMSEVVRNVTIYMDTQKRMAKRFKVEEFEQRGRGKVVRVRFMEKGARTRWWLAEANSLVIIDGWDHPEFLLADPRT